MNCVLHEDTSTCASVPMTSGLFQCCSVKMDYQYSYGYNHNNIQICSVWVTFDYTEEQIKSMEKSYQEAQEFLNSIYNYNIPSFILTYACTKNSFTWNYGRGTFTEEEKAIIRDENYCLRLYYEGLYQLGYIADIIGSKQRTITKDICLNGKTLPNSGNMCGYASFTFKLGDGTSEKISTCMMVNKLSYETKSLDKLLEQDFQQFYDLDGEVITSFDVEVTNKDGKVLKYDSLTKSVTIPNSSKLLRISLLIILSLLISLF